MKLSSRNDEKSSAYVDDRVLEQFASSRMYGGSVSSAKFKINNKEGTTKNGINNILLTAFQRDSSWRPFFLRQHQIDFESIIGNENQNSMTIFFWILFKCSACKHRHSDEKRKKNAQISTRSQPNWVNEKKRIRFQLIFVFASNEESFVLY